MDGMNRMNSMNREDRGAGSELPPILSILCLLSGGDATGVVIRAGIG